MRIRYSQQQWGRHQQPGQGGAGVIPLEWRQEWFTDLCLAVILTALLFFMTLSIYLVFTKPAPVSIPGGTGGTAEEAAYADIPPLADGDARLFVLMEDLYDPNSGLV